MARLVTSGFELSSVTASIEVDAVVSGTPAIVTSPVHGGTYALQFALSSAAAYVRYNFYASNTSNQIYVRAWINIGSMPAAAASVMGIQTATSTTLAKISLLPAGTLELQNSSSTQVGSVSQVLSTNTWYCVELFLDSSTNNGNIAGRVNGNVFASGAGNAAAGAARAFFGVTNATTVTMTYDDIAINDNTGSFQTSYPGLGYIVRATPNAAGDSNTFGTQVGGTAGSANNYTRVNETTPDGTTSYNASAVAASDLFAVSVPAIPAGATINCVVIGSEAANLTGADATASFQLQIEKTSGGTISKSSAIIPDTTTMKVNPTQPGVSTYPFVLYNDPDGNAWKPSTIASMQIGYMMDVVHTDPIAVSTVWALVDYTPAATSSGFFDFF